jgi:large subunit ribosomal protein L15
MLHNLPSPKTKKKSKRLGRGMGSGVGGHTVGRGLKGATARTGYQSPRPGFEGGQNPLSRRLPKFKGFTRAYIKSTINPVSIKLSRIARIAEQKGDTDITMEKLIEYRVVKPKYSKSTAVKVLFDKEIEYKMNFKDIKTSTSAKEAIEKAGGSVA